MRLAIILFGLPWALRAAAIVFPKFRAKLKENNLIAQIKLTDDSVGRYFEFNDGKIKSGAGIHENADVTLWFKSEKLALKVLSPIKDYGVLVHAGKNFQMGLTGDDPKICWFMEMMGLMMTAGWNYGKDMGDGVRRLVNNTNGGPVYVDVKDDKIIRVLPIDFSDDDAASWKIDARGKEFVPPRKATITSYSLAWKSMIYSENRNLYPMKRVDFDPNGERNPQNRGKSGY